MSGPDKAHSIVYAIIEGGELAFRRFYDISGGDWLDEAPEYFMTACVAESVTRLDKTYALLEWNVRDTKNEAGAKIRENTSGKSENGRFDVVLYWAGGNPRAGIEIKSPLWFADESKIRQDIVRLADTMTESGDSTFQFCAFAYYVSVPDPKTKYGSATQWLRDVLARIDEKSLSIIKEYSNLKCLSFNGTIHRGKEEESGAWTIGVQVVVKQGSERAFTA